MGGLAKSGVLVIVLPRATAPAGHCNLWFVKDSVKRRLRMHELQLRHSSMPLSVRGDCVIENDISTLRVCPISFTLASSPWFVLIPGDLSLAWISQKMLNDSVEGNAGHASRLPKRWIAS